ncbi:MAG: DUF1922 domain-containing protein [Candidatus Asgardarchaeia archaeon]
MALKYVVVQCPNCGRFTFSRRGTKARQCPFCGKIFQITPERRIKEVNSPNEAKVIVQQLNRYETLSKLKRRNKVLFEKPNKKPKSYFKLRKEVLRLLKLNFNNLNEISLNKLLEISQEEGYEIDDVLFVLERLSDEGIIFFPSPDRFYFLGDFTLRERCTINVFIKRLMKMISAKKKNNESLVSYSEIVNLAKLLDCGDDLIERAINYLKEKGLIYESSPREYKIIS